MVRNERPPNTVCRSITDWVILLLEVSCEVKIVGKQAESEIVRVIYQPREQKATLRCWRWSLFCSEWRINWLQTNYLKDFRVSQLWVMKITLFCNITRPSALKANLTFRKNELCFFFDLEDADDISSKRRLNFNRPHDVTSRNSFEVEESREGCVFACRIREPIISKDA
jgi:hypothetical protein